MVVFAKWMLHSQVENDARVCRALLAHYAKKNRVYVRTEARVLAKDSRLNVFVNLDSVAQSAKSTHSVTKIRVCMEVYASKKLVASSVNVTSDIKGSVAKTQIFASQTPVYTLGLVKIWEIPINASVNQALKGDIVKTWICANQIHAKIRDNVLVSTVVISVIVRKVIEAKTAIRKCIV